MEKRIMDAATRKKLAGLLPFAPGSFVRATLSIFEELPQEFRPTFSLRSWSASDQAYIISKSQTGTLDLMVMATALKSVVLGWDNLLDASTLEMIPFSKEIIPTFSGQLIGAIFEEVNKISGLSDEEKEGLELRPPSLSEAQTSSSKTVQSADIAPV